MAVFATIAREESGLAESGSQEKTSYHLGKEKIVGAYLSRIDVCGNSNKVWGFVKGMLGNRSCSNPLDTTRARSYQSC